MTFQPGWAPSGSTEAMLPSQLRPAPGSLDPSTRERVCVFMCASVHPCERVCVCVCVRVCMGLGEGGLLGNESAT